MTLVNSILNVYLYKQRKLFLYLTPNRFYIQPIDIESEALVIGRQDHEIKLDSNFSRTNLLEYTRYRIYGILGIKEIPNDQTGEIADRVLIVITHAIELGAVKNHTIYEMQHAEVIYFDPESDSNPSLEGPKLALEAVLETPTFYFSYTIDLTNNLQKLITTYKPTYNPRFSWNQHLMEYDGLSSVANKYWLPLILGFVSINKLDNGLQYTLISRRAVTRAGTRFNCRGADIEGNAANFVETEQIIEHFRDFLTSFVQIRGSIPLAWSQVPDYSYKPAVQFDIDRDQSSIMAKHFESLRLEYGDFSVINLIDHVGHEGILELEYSRRMMQTQIPYHNFNFHEECSRMRWHRLSLLTDELQPEIANYGYFAMDSKIQLQKGVFRTNCIDSLDRTNVVQSLIAQQVLKQIFNRFKITTSLVDKSNVNIFTNTWADNADLLSIQYAGTSALKTDFTRTGRRTYAGSIKDGLNSLNRYVLNNFYDDYRQDAIDFFLGKHKGTSICRRPLKIILKPYLQTLPTTLVVLTLLFLFFYFRY